jgi:soluble lytic murein transglycosylase-like protein
VSVSEPAASLAVRFADSISSAARIYDVHPALIAAVIHAESNFNPKAVSFAGARGLMQITGATQRTLQLKNAFDPHQNIVAGSKYLRQLLDRFNGNMKLAIAAYNAGPGAVSRYSGIPPYKETQAYVKKVLAYYSLYRNAFVSSLLVS